ncbi:DNA primase [Facklamia miroungae]|uniref:DNA primase n=1 Tax=Facklamia miroungae TaxID=120956 RepID=A0A1G7PK30_9LACT|nr:DNA primase [Facklamia miroungae]NKZ28738.1 DNA primase [Facklamia miroungae]SDF86484.1 DNA primase [Facklamia miroungae]
MSRIPNEVIEAIRQSVKIEDVVSQYVQLTKRGQGYSASCPFHEDNNPSFSIHTGKQIYKCFSCGRGGNVFGFIQEIESLSFKQAVIKVAEFANYPLDVSITAASSEAELPREHQHLYGIYDKASEFYQYFLTGTENGDPAFQYLLKRGLNRETIEAFGLGLAPENSKLLWTFLKDQAFSDEDLLASGIFYQAEDSQEIVDRFRGRIIFPLRSSQGQVLAFSGRIYQAGDPRKSKYVNSPETAIFHKGRLVYNLDLARPAIRRLKQIIICEGFMDVIALYDAGFEQAVATMGTSLSHDHLAYLSKLAQEMIFVFDGDEAGQKATAKAFELGKQFPQVNFKAVHLPNGMDPDEWIKQKGKDAFQNQLNRAQSAFTFYKDYQKQFFQLADKRALADYIDQLLIALSQIQSPVEKQLYLLEIAQEYQIEEDFLQERMLRLAGSLPKQKQESGQVKPVEALQLPSDKQALAVKSFKAFQSEKLWLGFLMYYPEAWLYLEKLKEIPFLYHDFSQKAFLALTEYYYQGNKLPLTGIVGNIEDIQVNSLLTSVMWDFEPIGYHDQAMTDCLDTIQIAFCEQEIEELKTLFKQYNQNQEANKATEVINKLMALQRKLKTKN